MEGEEGVLQVVLLTDTPNLSEPRLDWLGRKQDIYPMLVKNVARTKSSNHTKEAEHTEMYGSSCWEAASKEHDNTFWGALMQLHNSF